MKSAPAKKMLGYAVYHRHLDLAKAETAIVEQFLPSASEKRFDYAIARSTAAPSEVKIVNLTRDASAANAKYAELCSARTADPTEFNICVRSNSGQNRFWTPVSLMKGKQVNQDVYALLADYVQQVSEAKFAKVNPAEADLKVKTLPEWNAWILSKQEALKSLYSGKGESLAFNTQFRLIAYNKVTQQTSLWFNAKTRNMKNAVHQMAMRAVDFTFKKEQSKYWAYVMAANEGNPFFCSEGDLDSEICKRIIGNAVSQRWISGPLELLFDRGLDSGHNDYFYYALLRTEDGKVERMDLEANHGMAVGRFRALFPTDRTLWKYKAGVMSHTGFPWWTSQRFSAELPRSPYEFHDVYDLIAEHVQKDLKSFVESGAEEKIAGLETQNELVARTDAKLASLRSLYKGTNPRLYKPYQFGITVLNKRDNWLGHGYWQANVHLGNFMNAATQHLFNRWIKSGTQQPAYLIYSQSEGVMHCSESEDLSDYYCRVMIGYAVQTRRLWAPEAMTDPLRNNPNGKDRGWAIVTRAKDSDKITKMFTREAAKFNQMRA